MISFLPKNTNSKTLIITGFSLVIVLMTLIIIISVTEFKQASQQLHEIVNVNNYKKKLVETMHISAFKRVSSLQRMVLLSDVFEQDDEAMFIDEQGGVFTKARQKLLTTRLNDQESSLLGEQSQYAQITVPLIRQVVNLTREGKIKQAQSLIQNDLIPAQLIIFNALSNLQKIQEKNINNAFNSMLSAQSFSRYYMLGLGLAAAILSIMIAMLTYKRVRRAEKQLSYEKERAQITLKNIVDGVITTNDHGLVDFINPTAVALTGWQQHLALGQPLLTVLNLMSPQMEKCCGSLEELKHCDIDSLILLTRDNKEIAIEYNTSNLPSDTIHKGGLVVTFQDVTKARELNQTLSYQATHDPLTGLYNRMAFEEKLENRIKDSRNKKQSHILCFLDLDHFKEVNDSAGHVAGDELLIELTKIFSKHVRNSDFLARMGGDEFAIILENCNTDKALDITEDIRHEIDEYRFEWLDKKYHVSVSIGITIITSNAKDNAHVLAQADKACYLAKESGRNLIKFFTDTTNKIHNLSEY
ncbi:MAG: diguanylate cyclase [Gammaproteobacteria bacterium]|nr:diguanylate cyclase [Gammaproteobacteria bacterium]